MRSLVLVMLGATGLTAVAFADTYWIAWEGSDANDWPEFSGWERVWGNWDGQYQGDGAIRTLENGVLTYDSLFDEWVYDFYERYRPQAMDPGPNEVFVLQWGLWVESVISGTGDPGVGVASDEGWMVGYEYDLDSIYSTHEYITIPLPPGTWHDFILISGDMRAYDLYIDGVLAREGWFAKRFTTSSVGWGDCVQGAASLHHWNYVRLGVLSGPPPQSGDLNCDGTVDLADINPFVLALTDAGAYQGMYPACWPQNGDINGDGSVNFGDINPFVDLLTS